MFRDRNRCGLTPDATCPPRPVRPARLRKARGTSPALPAPVQMVLGQYRKELGQREHRPPIAAAPGHARGHLPLEVVDVRHDLQLGDEKPLLEAKELSRRVIDVFPVARQLIISAQEGNTHVKVVSPQGVLMKNVHQNLAIEGAIRQARVFVGNVIRDIIGDFPASAQIEILGHFMHAGTKGAAVVEAVDAGKEMMHPSCPAKLLLVPERVSEGIALALGSRPYRVTPRG